MYIPYLVLLCIAPDVHICIIKTLLCCYSVLHFLLQEVEGDRDGSQVTSKQLRQLLLAESSARQHPFERLPVWLLKALLMGKYDLKDETSSYERN